ncbi:hypothetical protein [Candidatus Methanoperedens nitratireducens]|uniref:Uncharacterized protein n=1 Tax=Candidatus Methanoperedens nitratireducens TaxID=1392998 RepID=A0A284VPI8_9EURY|nr:hypothetical protein [Candidatus Methanoperedens nitroreducens]SNQ61206.1 conserved hypothetical protein [Candidatus Methanoperedens nitroreducens]
MTIIEKYKTYRNIAKELNHKIMNTCLDQDVLKKSARLLGIARGEILVFESENDTSVLMDFALYDYRANKQNAIEIYREKIGWQNEIEKEILDAYISSYTSLFKVISISEAENSLILSDLLNKKDNIKLIDIALSITAVPGLLVFIRLIPFKDFNMAAGSSFAFPSNSENYLLRRYKILSRKVKSGSDSIKRFVSFYKLSKTQGIEVRYL